MYKVIKRQKLVICYRKIRVLSTAEMKVYYAFISAVFFIKERKCTMETITKIESEKLSHRMKQLVLQYIEITNGIEASQVISKIILELNANSEAGKFITVIKYKMLMGILDIIFQEAEEYGTFINPFEGAKIIEVLVHYEI